MDRPKPWEEDDYEGQTFYRNSTMTRSQPYINYNSMLVPFRGSHFNWSLTLSLSGFLFATHTQTWLWLEKHPKSWECKRFKPTALGYFSHFCIVLQGQESPYQEKYLEKTQSIEFSSGKSDSK